MRRCRDVARYQIFETGERSQNGILSTLARRKESNARHGLGSMRSIVSSGNGVGIYANDISSDVLIRDGKRVLLPGV